jgi:hypothetical protein
LPSNDCVEELNGSSFERSREELGADVKEELAFEEMAEMVVWMASKTLWKALIRGS